MSTHQAMARDPFTGVAIRVGVMGSAREPVEPTVAAFPGGWEAPRVAFVRAADGVAALNSVIEVARDLTKTDAALGVRKQLVPDMGR